MWHRHKFGKVEPDGFQYCLKCGKAWRPTAPVCAHVWKIESKSDVVMPRDPNDESKGTFVYAKKYILRCAHCGNMRDYTSLAKSVAED